MYIVKKVKALDGMKLLVTFRNGVEKLYDVSALYEELPQFRALEDDMALFLGVHVDVGGYGVSWNDELDLVAEELWENGEEIGNREIPDVLEALAESLCTMRKRIGMTQVQLAEKTGIAQADISKIERGLANPSLSTLKRLADGMGVRLQIGYVETVEDVLMEE